jgi:probable rRNA maturation factor
MDIQIADDLSDAVEEPPSSSLMQSWAEAAWQGANEIEAVLSLRIVSAEESQQLNSDFRGKNNPTNVLSFPMQIEADFEDVSMPELLLGDLAICAEVVASEAKQQKKTAAAHWAHMVVHGMLHLQGFDHIEDNEAEEMELLESKILQQLGFTDPYQINVNNTEDLSVTETKS